MDVPFVTIITPTYNRNQKIIERCIRCVEMQTYRNFEHLIIVDDVKSSPHISMELFNKYRSPQREFIVMGKRSNDWGNSVKQYGIDLAKGKYIVFVDDDNVILPHFLEYMVNCVETTGYKIGICSIIHLGPLAEHLGSPPKILNGNPPVVQNIDNMQVIVDAKMMKQEGFEVDKGYTADGSTIQKICSKYEYAFINEILAIHM